MSENSQNPGGGIRFPYAVHAFVAHNFEGHLARDGFFYYVNIEIQKAREGLLFQSQFLYHQPPQDMNQQT